MKKKIIVIVACILFVLYCFSGCFYIHHCRKYKIVGASLQRAIVEDSVFKDSNVYLLNFDVIYCDDTLLLGFMQSPYEPGIFGCADTIKHISITDSSNNDVHFIYEPAHEYYVLIEGESEYYSSSIITGGKIDSLVNNINSNNENGERFYINMPRFYKLGSKMPKPKHLKIYSNHGVVNGTVDENPVLLRIQKDN